MTTQNPQPDPEPLPETDPRRIEWVKRIVDGSTPKREYGPDGEFRGWIDPDRRERGAA